MAKRGLKKGSKCKRFKKVLGKVRGRRTRKKIRRCADFSVPRRRR